MAETGQKNRSRTRAPFRWLARELSRIRLTVWLLIVMGVTMIVGSIFPQGYGADTYVASWGEARYELFLKLGLLNLFHTKYFLILGAILLLNLVFCSLLRWFGRAGTGFTGSRAPEHARVVPMAGDASAASSRARDVLTARKFKILSEKSGVLTARRGPWPEGVSLLYHIAMAAAIVGFIISALTSFEGDVTLYPGEPISVATANSETGAHRLRNTLADWSVGGWRPFSGARPDTTAFQERQLTLVLNEFVTEWEFHNEKYYPKDWLSHVSVRPPGDTASTDWKTRIVEVNLPLREAGLTFYQMAYEQEFDVVVALDGEEVERVEAQAYVPFTLESVDGMFFPGTLRVGTLFQKYHDPVPIVPHIPLKWQPPTPEPEEELADTSGHEGAATDMAAVAETDTAALLAAVESDDPKSPPPPPPERVELGDLSAGEPLELGGHTLTLENPYEGSVLTYRHDPGVPLLYVAIIAFMVGLAMRTYWPSYRVNLWIEDAPAGATGRLAFRAAGMLGEPEEIEDALARELSGGAGS